MATGIQDSDGFPGTVATKATPTTLDIVALSDIADAGKMKKATFASLPFASKSLDNLIAPTAINADLIPGIDDVLTLGTFGKAWGGILTSTVVTDTTAGKTTTFSAYDTNVGMPGYQPFIVMTAGDPPTCVFGSDITSSTQLFGTNDTTLATTAFVAAAIAGSGAVTSVSGTANRITSTGGTTPVIDISASYVGQASITTLGTITTGVWNGTDIALIDGGTNASLVASNGGIVYSTAGAMAILSGTATGGQIIRSGASAAPSWSTATYPNTTTVNQLLYSSSGNIIGGLVTANSGTLVTNMTGVPSINGPMTDGQILIGSTGATPVIASITAGSGVTITPGAGTIQIDATGSGGTVTSVSGTANRITSTGGATPVIDISASYVGQASITTLGTITTGVWNGTDIALIDGGTGASLVASTGGIVYSAAGAMAILAGTATAGQIVRSGASAAPTWSTATYPATTTINRLLYSSAANVISDLATANSGTLATSSTGVPSIAGPMTDGQLLIGSTGATPTIGSITAGAGVTVTPGAGTIQISATGSGGTVTSVSGTANRITSTGGATPVIDISASYVGQASITTLGTITTGIWNGTDIALIDGGSGASLVASTGGIVYSGAGAMAILSGTATARQMLQSGASAAPAWSTTTWPATTTINRILYSSAANTISDLATANSGVLVTSSAGVPSIAGPMTNGQLIIGSTSATPVAAAITAGTGITVTNGAGSIQIAATGGSGITIGQAFAMAYIFGR